MATTHKLHGGRHVIIIHLCRCQSKGVYINDIPISISEYYRDEKYIKEIKHNLEQNDFEYIVI